MNNDLSNLKVGDEVILSQRFNNDRVVKIEKITPKGFIKIGNYLFYPNGKERGGNRWYPCHISIATKEKTEIIKRKSFCRQTLNFLHELKEITYDQAVKIMEVLGDKK